MGNQKDHHISWFYTPPEKKKFQVSILEVCDRNHNKWRAARLQQPKSKIG